jgi:hypothetical protein
MAMSRSGDFQSAYYAPCRNCACKCEEEDPIRDIAGAGKDKGNRGSDDCKGVIHQESRDGSHHEDKEEDQSSRRSL